ncbi:MAG: V-type ATPase subunit [Eubacteriales bacterium]|nr:V-type ATPase subunit [Eubacteriales bacterium]MDY3332845.1 V-type ATPase subunit [Gallibacter sp.]
MAKLKNKYSYTFVNAYIASISKNLMSYQDLLRVTSAKDLFTAEAMLHDFGYGEVKELRDGYIEAFIRREQKKLHDDIYKTMSDVTELALWLIPLDYHNIRVCLKSELLDIDLDPETHLVSSGNIEPMKMKAMIHERNYTFMSDTMKNAIEGAIDIFSRSQDPQEIDILLDKACYEEMLYKANEIGEPFLIDMVKAQIDQRNLKSFVRIKKMGKDSAFYKKIFLVNGDVPLDLYVTSFDESYAAIGEKLSPYGLKQAASEGGQEVKENGNFGILEKYCSEFILKLNRKAKYQTFGLAPIAWYWYAKNVELNNLRVILLGLKINMQVDKIIERLSDPDV